MHGTRGDGPALPALTRAAALAVGDDAAEVPEAGLAAVTLQAPHAGLAGALPRCRVAGSPVGAIGVALAGACEPERESMRLSPGQGGGGTLGAASGQRDRLLSHRAAQPGQERGLTPGRRFHQLLSTLLLCPSYKGELNLQGLTRLLCCHQELLSH